jgi:hypothetical protein
MSDPVPVPIEYAGEVHRVEKGMIFCLDLAVNQVAVAVSQAPLDSPLPRCRTCFPEVCASVEVPPGMVVCDCCGKPTAVDRRICTHCDHPTADG